MSESPRCPVCGNVLPQTGDLVGSCIRCLLELGFESAADEAGAAGADFNPDRSMAASPEVIGRYRILRLLGQGGMGAVYEAEQDQPRRTVALKIIKPGMATPELLRRFEQESQALGRLQHPGIAQIYEAGTVDTGFGPQPYFAMELIHGSTPLEYAESRKLNSRERLAIMAKICDAVHHAHLRGLIHRDLKPGNILVDETGQPKILDFGVARVTDSDARATLHTDVGQLIGTLAYMSPEQVLADPQDLDTRSDVYSLGVILYELLTGLLPYPISKKIHENIQTIRGEDPVRLSLLSRTFRGDIETIVAKALEKDRLRRYASASEMAADIHRFLNHEPIIARPPSPAYQLGKFAQRNRALVTGVAAVIITLTLGVAAATWWALQAGHERDHALQARKEASEQSDRANDNEKKAEAARQQAVAAQQQAQIDRDDAIAQKERADREAAIAKAVREFLGNDLLQMANPVRQPADSSRNPDITVKEALGRAASRIGSRFENQPLVEAEIREIIADTDFGIGDNTNAREHWERALDLRRRTQGGDHPQALHIETRLVAVNYKLNRLGDAETLIASVLQSAGRIAKSDKATLHLVFSDLVEAFESTVIRRSAAGISTVELGLMGIIDDIRYNSGNVQNSDWAVAELVELHQLNPRSSPDRSRDFLEQLYQYHRLRLGDENATTITTLRQLHRLYMAASLEPDYVRAESFLRPLVADQRRKLGDSNRATQVSMEMLIGIYTGQPQPKLTDAIELLEAALASARRTLNISNPTVRQMTHQLASLYFQQKKYVEAETLLVPMVSDSAVQSIIRGDQRSPNEILSLLDSMDMLSQIYAIRGKAGPADGLAKSLNDVLAVLAATDLTSESATTFPGMGLVTMGNFGLRYLSQGRDSEGNALIGKMLEGYRIMARKDPSSQSVSYPLLISATEILKDNGVKEEKFLRDLLELQRAELGNDNPATTFTTRILSHQYLMHYKFAESEALAEDLIVSYARVLGPSNIGTLLTMNQLSLSYAAAYSYALMHGQPEQARVALEKGAAHAARFLAAKLNSPDGKIYGEMQFPFLSLGNAYAALGRYSEAEAVFKQYLAFQEEMAVAPGLRLPTLASIGRVQYQQQKYSDAETSLRRAANGLRNAETWERYNTESMLGAVLVAQEKYSEAEPLLVAAFDQTLQRSPRTSMFFGSTLFTAEAEPGERILELYQKWGKPENVREWRQKVQGAPNFRTPPPPEFSLSYVPPLERMLR